jgi:folate-dependent phosphoribosylglycinamide formyltransferase PurN
MAGVLLLAGPGPSTWIVANALAREHADLTVVIEERESRAVFLRRRARKLGPLTVAGQVLFQLWSKIGAHRADARVREIMDSAGLDDRPMEPGRYRRVASANDPAVVSLIATAGVGVVVVNGTRILSRAFLDAIGAIGVPVLNTHAGITPAYRGVHGGYWARARGDMARCGVTVHKVDAGVDTGAVVAQAAIAPGPQDNFFSYPMLQMAAAMPLLLEAVREARNGQLSSGPAARSAARHADGESRQYYHPTLWGYVATGLRRGVW